MKDDTQDKSLHIYGALAGMIIILLGNYILGPSNWVLLAGSVVFAASLGHAIANRRAVAMSEWGMMSIITFGVVNAARSVPGNLETFGVMIEVVTAASIIPMVVFSIATCIMRFMKK